MSGARDGKSTERQEQLITDTLWVAPAMPYWAPEAMNGTGGSGSPWLAWADRIVRDRKC